MSGRPSWDEYFLSLLDNISKRATCDRGRSGAIIVSESNTILTSGYVGSAPGDKHCDDIGHYIVTVIQPDGTSSRHCERTLHAEENAILQAAMDGIRLRGSTLYCKMVPCIRCARRIVRVGIRRIVAQKAYQADELSRKLFIDAKVELVIIDDSVEEYKKQ